ncbi:MAG: type II toxin-antitoxin system RelE/ParE family toxin [Flavobacteriales bacterium]|nr:type II toxin-antitoxin system RelE/ParE family toxin [Flavobacteriales bacterium]
MEVLFLRSFERDLAKADAAVKRKLILLIATMEQVEHVTDLAQVKKLKGHKDAYRLRMGRFRLGFFVEDRTILLARLLDRKEIYRFFP